MDYGKLTLDELKKGYRYEKEKEACFCNYCGQCFDVGQIFFMENNFYAAERAVEKHIIAEHGGNVSQLLADQSKYNALTANQKELLVLINTGISDKEIAKKTNVAEATVRRQRFTFREKAKQAKFYLAVYEQIFESKSDDDLIPLHNHASYVDDRYLITESERQHILETSFSSLQPLVLKDFSSKEKKKVVILSKIAQQLEYGKYYSEKEVNQILKPIFADYLAIRRYLIMYGFVERTKDGSQYWLTE